MGPNQIALQEILNLHHSKMWADLTNLTFFTDLFHTIDHSDSYLDQFGLRIKM